MGARSGLLAAAASVLLLAGCAPAPQLPAPMTEAEAQRIIDDSNRMLWDSMFPGEPMPVVTPVQYVEPGGSPTEVTDCLNDSGLEGVTFNLDGTWVRTTANNSERERAMNIARFICDLKFPVDLSDPSKLGFLTEDQKTWIATYNRERLIPCLQQLGYVLPTRTAEYRDNIKEWWLPYFDITPVPASDAEWARIDLRCPPPPNLPPLPRPTVE